MFALGIAVATFVCLAVAALTAIRLSLRLPEAYREPATDAVVRLVSAIFTLMTSLVFGLMINSARNTYETTGANVHVYATSLIILDRTLRRLGVQGEETRQLLTRHLEEAIAHPARADSIAGNPAALALDVVGTALVSLHPDGPGQDDLASDARQQYRDVVKTHWTIVEQSEGAIPTPLIAMLVAWLTVIFATFGFRAPPNVLTVGLLVFSSALIAASFYLVLDMSAPFSGPVKVSSQPLSRALAEARLPR